MKYNVYMQVGIIEVGGQVKDWDSESDYRVEDRVTVTCASFYLTSFAILVDVGET